MTAADELTIFYDQLEATIQLHKNRSAIFILAGDFNSKVGLQQEGGTFMGKYGKGTRNTNGHQMTNFLVEKQLYLSNTHFQHSMRHRTTWTGYIQGKIYRNQIDYIVILQRQKHLITDARTRTGAKFQSDHNLVITTFNLSNIYHQRRIEHNQKNKYDLAALAQDPEIKRNFQQQITININNLPHITNLAESDSNLTEIILTAAKNTIPKAPILLDGKIKYYHDAAIVRM